MRYLINKNRINSIIDSVALVLVQERVATLGIKDYQEIELEYLSKSPEAQRIAKIACMALARQYPTTDELLELAGDDPTPTRTVDWGKTLKHIER